MSAPRINPNLLKVPLYIAGKSIQSVKEEFGLDEVIKLASNESPVGPSPMALKAVHSALAQAHRYPGALERDLRRKLANSLDPELNEENIITGNGGTDILRIITQAFVFDGGNCVMSRATFPMYHIFVTTFDGEVRQVEPCADYSHNLPAMARRIDEDTRIVFLCSPNNPSGHIITQAQADAFMAEVPDHVVVIFDESYYDYVTLPNHAKSLSYIKAGRNVLSVRSFSKTAGLANMRVGYLIGPVSLTEYIQHVKLPFHTSDIALAAASASLDDEAYKTESKKAVIAGREYLYTSLNQLGVTALPSQGNFVVFTDLPAEPTMITDALLRRGIIVRAMGAFGMPNGIRVSVGPQAENEKFIEVLGEVLKDL